MKKTTLFTTHKKASITIIVFLVLSNLFEFNHPYEIGDALRN